MKLLSSEIKGLLDRLYNLRGSDSVILTQMNKEREPSPQPAPTRKNTMTNLLL